MCVYTHTCISTCSNIVNVIQLKTYNQNIILYIFVKRKTKPIIVEWKTPTKTNLNANISVNVNILANVLVCT